jgi:hypothetical protein
MIARNSCLNQLGSSLVAPVPIDNPEAYHRWLEGVRAMFSDFEDRVEKHFFTVPITAIVDNDSLLQLSSLGLGGLQVAPKPWDVFGCNMVKEWVYVVDLDAELLIVNNCCYFRMDKLTADWTHLIPRAQKYLFDPTNSATIHPSITDYRTKFRTAALGYDPKPGYERLNPLIFEAKRASGLNRKPHVVLCKKLYEKLVRDYNERMTFKNDTIMEGDDFLFREIIFALLCLSSCSTELVRLAPSDTFTRNPNRLHVAAIKTEKSEEPEFVSSLFEGFHLPGNRRGSAPDTTCYWFNDVLVHTTMDLASEAQFQDKIIAAVNFGRSEGREQFNGIVISLLHVVLFRVLESSVQHTKRLQLVEPKTRSTLSYDYEKGEESDEDREMEDVDNKAADERGVEDITYSQNQEVWIDSTSNQSGTFNALAHLFEAQNSRL